MSSKTTNYNLHKIDLSDAPPDITVLNQNWDIIDQQLKLGDSKVTQVEMENAIETAIKPALRVVSPSIGDLAEGSIIQIIEEGTPVDFCVAKHNYEGTGRTLVVRKAHSSTVTSFANTSTNKYESSRLDIFLNETYITRLDSKVQSALAEVPIEVTGTQSSTVYTINRKIFELSATEYGLSVSEGATLGSVLPVATSILPEKGSNGNSTWSRTAVYTTSGNVYVVNKTDGVTSVSATTSLYYQPAFTLPADYSYSDETIIVGNGKVFDFATANQYVWRKAKQTYSTDSAKTFSFNMYSSVTDGQYDYQMFTYGTGYTISDSGKVSLTGTFTSKATNSTNYDSFWSKKTPFYMMDNGQLYYVTNCRIPSSTYIEFNGNMIYFKTSVTDLDFVSSTDPNAYPSGEIVDGWLYEKAGLLSANCVSGQQTGSGTTAMSIDIGFTPKLLIITDDYGNGNRAIIQCGNTKDSLNHSSTDFNHLRVSLSSTAVLHRPYSANAIFSTQNTYMWTAFR